MTCDHHVIIMWFPWDHHVTPTWSLPQSYPSCFFLLPFLFPSAIFYSLLPSLIYHPLVTMCHWYDTMWSSCDHHVVPTYSLPQSYLSCFFLLPFLFPSVIFNSLFPSFIYYPLVTMCHWCDIMWSSYDSHVISSTILPVLLLPPFFLVPSCYLL